MPCVGVGDSHVGELASSQRMMVSDAGESSTQNTQPVRAEVGGAHGGVPVVVVAASGGAVSLPVAVASDLSAAWACAGGSGAAAGADTRGSNGHNPPPCSTSTYQLAFDNMAYRVIAGLQGQRCQVRGRPSSVGSPVTGEDTSVLGTVRARMIRRSCCRPAMNPAPRAPARRAKKMSNQPDTIIHDDTPTYLPQEGLNERGLGRR
jgi:hypothetical protein